MDGSDPNVMINNPIMGMHNSKSQVQRLAFFIE